MASAVVQINIDKEAIEEHVRELVAPSLEAAADLADAVTTALKGKSATPRGHELHLGGGPT